MRVLLVYCHPDPASFCAAVRDAALAALQSAGHKVRVLDLYAEHFDPVLSREDWQAYDDAARNGVQVAEHVARLRWAEGLVFVYPTWWYGQPAMLRGWIERVFLPDVAFALPTPRRKTIRPLLGHIKLLAAVTTLGSPWWWWMLMGQPGRRTLLMGIGALTARRCRKLWVALHDMDHVTAAQRAAFLRRVGTALAAR